MGTKNDDVSDCGCVWARTPEYGDVIVMSCAAHKVDPVSITRTDLSILAGKVASGKISENDAAEQVAELCMKHGPQYVRSLDYWYEKQLLEERWISGEKGSA